MGKQSFLYSLIQIFQGVIWGTCVLVILLDTIIEPCMYKSQTSTSGVDTYNISAFIRSYIYFTKHPEGLFMSLIPGYYLQGKKFTLLVALISANTFLGFPSFNFSASSLRHFSALSSLCRNF